MSLAGEYYDGRRKGLEMRSNHARNVCAIKPLNQRDNQTPFGYPKDTRGQYREGEKLDDCDMNIAFSNNTATLLRMTFAAREQ